jgi:hypothetical protein
LKLPAAVLVLGLLAAPVQGANGRAEARLLGDEGLTLFDDRRYEEAYDKFVQAEALFHAPTHLLFMARCSAQLGRLLEARRLYGDVAGEALAADAPPQFVEAKRAAAQESSALSERIPRLAIVVRGTSAARVVVDEVAVTSLEQPLDVDPGMHVVAASVEGRTVRETVTVPEGSGVTRVEIDLTRPAAAPPTAPAPAPPALPPREPETRALYWPAGLAFSLGAAGMVVGGVAAAVALATLDDVRSRCVDGRCPPEDAALGDRAGTLADLATASFVVAGVGLAAGVFLAIFPPRETVSSTVRITPHGMRVSF